MVNLRPARWRKATHDWAESPRALRRIALIVVVLQIALGAGYHRIMQHWHVGTSLHATPVTYRVCNFPKVLTSCRTSALII